MSRFLFGMDASQPEAFAKALAAKGYTACVCAPTARNIDALRSAGLSAYACAAAFPLSDGGDLCVDLAGERRVWFGSACPSDARAAEASLARIARLAQTDGLSGVYLDGARFASPASPEGIAAFFTCFCPHCAARARQLGIDLDRARSELTAWKDGAARFPEGLLALRAAVTADFFRRFAETVHGARPGMEAGAFVFAASLAPLVGQTRDAFCHLDALSPMLYRRYPEKIGPACLSHEYDALLTLLGRERTTALTGVVPPEAPLTEGFPPEALTREVRSARSDFPGRLEPILQLRDERLADSVAAVFAGGADGAGLFAYDGGGANALPRIG